MPTPCCPKWQLVQIFYDGLTKSNKNMVNASCGGTFVLKSDDEAWAMFAILSENSIQQVSNRQIAHAPKHQRLRVFFK